ncbi:MAG TPA: SctK family type III secretion system sorting platform protein [Alphaproteobacteria bacterium]|nr:SctK family type III secretion system sorting platform protein [Alphaproteobacteria bacterium]
MTMSTAAARFEPSLLAPVRFEHLPAAYIHPDHLVANLPAGVGADAAARLQACTRLRYRLSALLRERLALPSCGPDAFAAPDRRAALLDWPALEQAARASGAVWHRPALQRIVIAEPLRLLVSRIGQPAYAFALSCPRPADLPDEQTPSEPGALAAAIEEAGLRCLFWWCEALPRAIALRVRLKLPPAITPPGGIESEHRQAGAQIFATAGLEMSRHVLP